MEYTKGEWLKQSASGGQHLIYSENDPRAATLALVYDTSDADNTDTGEGNAALIVAAVNACQEVNPDNPLAVAESIKEMYDALKALVDASEPPPDSVWKTAEAVIAKMRQP